MPVGSELAAKPEIQAYVRFKRIAKEDKAASLKAGHYVGKDVDIVLITPPYSKDEVEQKVEQWKAGMEADVRNNRLPQEFMDLNLKRYQAWLNGQEMPLNGTPIKGWAVIGPAQQETLIRLMVLTVEDLAAVNDEGLRRIGMGAIDLKNKAVAWLQQAKDKGPLTMEMAAIKIENANQAVTIASLQRQLSDLTARLDNQNRPVPRETEESISADDILPEPESNTLKLKKK